MLSLAHPTPSALVLTLSGEVGREEVRDAMTAWRRTLEGAGLADMLIVIEGPVRMTLAGLMEDLTHVPDSVRALPRLGRIAIVSEPNWITAIARVEKAVIPGLNLELFAPEKLGEARRWVLRDAATPQG